jgi:hypothetical protein
MTDCWAEDSARLQEKACRSRPFRGGWFALIAGCSRHSRAGCSISKATRIVLKDHDMFTPIAFVLVRFVLKRFPVDS